MGASPWSKPSATVSDDELVQTAKQLELNPIELPIDDQRRLRAENFAWKIISVLSRVEQSLTRSSYVALTALGYSEDVELVARATARQ
jgi:hypothetical protein